MGLRLAWEVLQLPLYTLWRSGPTGKQAFGVLHCTVGDGMIAGITLLAALAVAGRAGWPFSRSRAVWLVSVLLGVGYTVCSEWLNVYIRGCWGYSALMPTLPVVGTGLSPLLQWIVVPTMAQWLAVRRAPWIDLAH
jgi:hypothetical protein